MNAVHAIPHFDDKCPSISRNTRRLHNNNNRAALRQCLLRQAQCLEVLLTFLCRNQHLCRQFQCPCHHPHFQTDFLLLRLHPTSCQTSPTCPSPSRTSTTCHSSTTPETLPSQQQLPQPVPHPSTEDPLTDVSPIRPHPWASFMCPCPSTRTR